ncbi:MAG: hypothetical protein D3916_09680 [Candidatus Electrothrix sp. MAN1_4]|nr:hypothetical protein [Candidatus Electrothrix sp. MAN1_4]
MNQKILFFAGILWAIPFVASAKGTYIDHVYSVKCEVLNETECIVKSNKRIKSVRVEFFSQEDKNSNGFMKKKFQDCPTEVSVHFTSPPGAKFFIEACDGSNGIKVLR